jgi:Domain of unknown function (DUF4870)/Short C-terminal domain
LLQKPLTPYKNVAYGCEILGGIPGLCAELARQETLPVQFRILRAKGVEQMSLSDEIQKLQQLHYAGALSDEEFAKAKARLLEESPPATTFEDSYAAPRVADPALIEHQTRQWAMLLHLSIFAGYVIPFGGLIVPILIWQIEEGGAAQDRRARQERRQLDNQPHHLHRRLHPAHLIAHRHPAAHRRRGAFDRFPDCGGEQG